MKGSGWLGIIGIELELKDLRFKEFSARHGKERLKHQYKKPKKKTHCGENGVCCGEPRKPSPIRILAQNLPQQVDRIPGFKIVLSYL